MYRRLVLIAIITALLPGCLLMGGCASMPRIQFGDKPDSTAQPLPLTPAVHSLPQTPMPEQNSDQELTVIDFLPLEQIFFRYLTTSQLDKSQPGSLLQSYSDVHVEYIDSQSYSVQHRIVSDSGSDVEVLRCQDGKLFRSWVGLGINYTHNFTRSTPNDDEVLLMDPIRVGTTWEIPFGTRTITAVNVPKHVGAGNFNVVVVQTDYSDKDRYIQYYLPGMGLLAQYTYAPSPANEPGDSPESFPDGSSYRQTGWFETTFREVELDFPQNIRFFFADPTYKVLRSVTREMTFGLNTSVERLMAAELRNSSVPGASGLLPLPPNAQINSITIGNNLVTVDFSAHLTEDTQLSAQDETLFFEAIAYTFADYYNVRRARITIEGENSKYGTISFDPEVVGVLR